MQLQLQKNNLIGPETTLYKINQSGATKKWRDPTCCALCDEKVDSGHKVLTRVKVNVKAVHVA